MTIFIWIISLLIVDNTSLLAQDTLQQKDYHIIMQKIDQLNERAKELETKLLKKHEAESVKNELKLIEEDVEEFSEILEKVERKSIVDRINLGAELRTRFDWFIFNGHDYQPYTGAPIEPKSYEVVREIPSNRFRLNLKADIMKTLKLNTRLVMHKNWADDDQPRYPEANFLNQARIPTDVNLKVERAYVDYFFEPIEGLPMAFSFGRIPTTDGLPTNLRENTPRKSTYPGLAYDCETDGIALSIDLKHFVNLHNPSLKIVYLSRVDDNETYVLRQKLSDKKGLYRVDDQAMDRLDIYISQFEAELNRPFRDTLFILNFLFIPKAPPSDLRYIPELQPFYDSNQTSVFADVPESEGLLGKLSCYIEAKNFLGSSIDWFLDMSYMKTKAKGALRFMFNPQALGLDDPPILARDAFNKYEDLINENATYGALLTPLKNVPTPIGLMNNDGISDRNAFAIHAGFRLPLPSLFRLNAPKLCFEYNYASKYWFGVNVGSEDPFHKLDLRGKVFDLYYIQPLHTHLLLRFGYTFANLDYDCGLMFYHGEPLPIDHDLTNAYMVMEARF